MEPEAEPQIKQPLAALPYFRKAMEDFSKLPKPTLAQVLAQAKRDKERQLMQEQGGE